MALDFLKRDTVKDPFGGEDGFDGESRWAGKGPKIALAASVVMFLALAGGIAAIVMTGKTTPPPVMGSLSDIEVVEEPGTPAAPATAQAGGPAGAPAPTVAADATAATDRSVERRPWLAAPPTAAAPDAKRLGMGDAPAAKAPAQIADSKTPLPAAKPAAPEPAKPALMSPPPAPAPAAVAAAPAAKTPVPPAPAPAAPTIAAAKPADAKSMEMAKVPAAKDQPPAKDAAPEPAVRAEPAKDKDKDTVVADASPFGPAPGAPNRFNLPIGADTGPAVVGGRPRLVEPQEPPTDKTAIAAPPPRFANIADAKKPDTSKTVSPAGTFKVAVVIQGLGLSQSATDTAITKLPAAVTLAFSPYARDLKKWLDKAKASGHEVLIEVPMESKEFPAQDPGPLGLLTSIDAKENATRLDTILKESGPAVGILDTEGSKFRESEPHLSAVFAKLKEKNLFYVQGDPGVRVGDASVPIAVADVVLDERPFRAAVDARLDYAERLAKYQGSAVASAGAKPVSFERLVLWLEQAQKKGIVLAPISEVLIRSETGAAPPAAKTPAVKVGADREPAAPAAKTKS